MFGIKHGRGAYGLLWLDVVVRVSITAESGPAGPSTKLITGVTKAKKPVTRTKDTSSTQVV